jgi:hypothetical protein
MHLRPNIQVTATRMRNTVRTYSLSYRCFLLQFYSRSTTVAMVTDERTNSVELSTAREATSCAAIR